MAKQPKNLVLELLRGMRGDMGEMRADMGEMRAVMATKADLAEVKSELKSDIHSLRADVASDMLTMQKDTRDQIGGLRRAVIEYHSAVVGHGMIISELEARVRRVEQHLNLPAMDAH